MRQGTFKRSGLKIQPPVTGQEGRAAVAAPQSSTEAGCNVRRDLQCPEEDPKYTRGLESRILFEDLDLLVVSPRSLNGSSKYIEEICRSQGVCLEFFSPESSSRAVTRRLDSIHGIPVVSVRRRSPALAPSVLKRGFDCIGAVVLFMLFLPVIVLAVLLVKCSSPGPVLFKQRRSLSEADEPFLLFKFRSMRPGAERDDSCRPVRTGSRFAKTKNDPRVTRFGRFMRRFSVDELPQLWNVIKGEMSLVGPRPLTSEDLSRLRRTNDLQNMMRLRSRAKPGITGLWQVSGRSDLGVKEMMLLDMYYVEHQNLFLDLRILLRTVPAILMGKGAY